MFFGVLSDDDLIVKFFCFVFVDDLWDIEIRVIDSVSVVMDGVVCV